MASIYRHFDKDGRLLYVGMSISVLARTRAHKRSVWFEQIARIEIQHFPTKLQAVKAERLTIANERPMHNITYASRRRPLPESAQQAVTDAILLDAIRRRPS
jgi:excinuclease UvrABC nuclease subunit